MIIEKPWGREIILFNNGKMRVKLLQIDMAGSLSYQFHKDKFEVLSLVSGNVGYLVDKKEGRFIEREVMVVNPGVCHRFYGAPKGELIEISFGKDEDIVRMADLYGRV